MSSIFFVVVMKKYLRIIFWLSFLCTIGSLYIEHFGDPLVNIMSGDLWNQSLGIAACNICRYIRVFTYPTVILSLIGIAYNDKYVARSIAALAFVCLIFCMYKFGLEMRRWSNGTNPFLCVSWAVDCAEAKPEYAGFITLSLMWAVVNAIIIVLSHLILNKNGNK